MSRSFKNFLKRASALVCALALFAGMGPWDMAAHAAETPFITSYTVLDAAGRELSTITPGTVFTLAVAINHPGIGDDAIAKAENIRARMHPGAFSMKNINDAYVKELAGAGTGTPIYDDSGSLVGTLDPLVYTIVFPNVTYVGGAASFIFDISYTNTNTNEGAGIPMSTLTLTVGQCVDNSTVPNITIRNTSYGGTAVTAGSAFTLSVNATNGSPNLTTEKVTVSISLPDTLTLNGGSSTVTVGDVGPGGNIPASFSLSAKAGAASGPASITLTYSFYATVQGQVATTPYTVTQTVSVPIQQPDRFTLGTHQIDEMMYLGNEAIVTINFTNKGKTSLYNVSGEIKGVNLANPSSEYQGTLAAGAEGSLDFYVMANEVGVMSGEVVITYEDDGGEVRTATVPFSIEVMEPYSPPIGPIDPLEPIDPGFNQGSGILPYVLVAVALVAAGGGYFFYNKKKKAAAAAELEDEDDLTTGTNGGDDEDF